MAIQELPTAAAKIIQTAGQQGWISRTTFDVDGGGNTYVVVNVARNRPTWHFRLSWHTRDTGSFRLVSRLMCHVPVDGVGTGWHGNPSVRYVLDTIEANPVQPREVGS